MPVLASISGSAMITHSGSLVSGTAAVTGSYADPAEGEATVDRSLFLAWNARVRETRPDVYIDTEPVMTLVDSVEIEETLDDPIVFATFAISDPRVAPAHTASFSDEDYPVSIDFWAGPPGGVKKWHVFDGTLESMVDDQTYRPRGKFRAVSASATWANSQGCVRYPAFAGVTRGEVLAALAESVGVTITNLSTLGGSVISKAVDFVGTISELIKAYGEVEGWYARLSKDGTGIEIVSEAQLLEGSAVYDFNQSNIMGIQEEIADHPVTDWILSGAQITEGSRGAIGGSVPPPTVETITVTEGRDDSGNLTRVTTKVVTDHGTEVHRDVITEATVQLPGDPSIIPAGVSFQTISREVTATVWTMVPDGSMLFQRPTTRMLSRITTSYALTGTPCNSSAGYVWNDGNRYFERWAVLMQISLLDESFTWGGADDCSMTGRSSRLDKLYSPLGDGFDYPNGVVRIETFYHMRTVETHTVVISEGKVIPAILRSWASDPTHAETDSSTRMRVTSISGSGNPIETLAPSSSVTTQVAGNVEKSSDTTPQFEQETITFIQRMSAVSHRTKREDSAVLIHPENVDELRAVSRRRLRRDHVRTYVIQGRTKPMLRVGDHVSVTDPKRNLNLADAYVWNIRRSSAVGIGAQLQTTVVKIPPSWV